MAKSPPSTPFYWNDYYRDTRVLSPAARGIWMDILCRLHESGRRGEMTLPLSAWISWCSCPQDVLEAAFREIAGTEVGIIRVNQTDLFASVPFGPLDVPLYVTVVSRRMVREEKYRESERLKKKRQRCPADVPPSVPFNVLACPPVPSSSSSSSSSDENPPTPLARGVLAAPGEEESDRPDRAEGTMRSGRGFTALSSGLREIFAGKLAGLVPAAGQSDTS